MDTLNTSAGRKDEKSLKSECVKCEKHKGKSQNQYNGERKEY